ncbi:MAG: tol-pal system protein YbgF [Polyangiales bacterium]
MRGEQSRIGGAGGALAFVALTLVLPACGGGNAQEMASMRDELARVQHEADVLQERIVRLEDRDVGSHAAERDIDGASPPTASSTTGSTVAPTAPSPGTPTLRVVKLAPATVDGHDAAAAPPIVATPGDADDDSPRPILRAGGSRTEETYPDEPAPGAKRSKPAIDPKAATEYEAALALFKAKKYPGALDAFAGFLVRYPDHPYAANAIYWRGESYFATGDFSSAASQFEGLLARFPTSPKTPDTLLKLGLTQRKLGSAAKAKAAFDRLRKEFPLSEAAKKIPPEDAS